MKATIAILLALPLLAACGAGGEAEDSSQYNDVATGVRLQNERPLQGADDAEWARRLAECSATLATHANQTPPPSRADRLQQTAIRDRKSTRLNSSHANISYAVFCLKKKNGLFPHMP